MKYVGHIILVLIFSDGTDEEGVHPYIAPQSERRGRSGVRQHYGHEPHGSLCHMGGHLRERFPFGKHFGLQSCKDQDCHIPFFFDYALLGEPSFFHFVFVFLEKGVRGFL